LGVIQQYNISPISNEQLVSYTLNIDYVTNYRKFYCNYFSR